MGAVARGKGIQFANLNDEALDHRANDVVNEVVDLLKKGQESYTDFEINPLWFRVSGFGFSFTEPLIHLSQETHPGQPKFLLVDTFLLVFGY